MSFDTCPHCGLRAFVDWLSTTNEWQRHCKKCDIRFNDEGFIRPDDFQKLISPALWTEYQRVVAEAATRPPLADNDYIFKGVL